MIGRGKYRDIHLYEVTRQDLLFETKADPPYDAGNILMFSDRRSIALGRESARARNLQAAKEYLDERRPLDAHPNIAESSRPSAHQYSHPNTSPSTSPSASLGASPSASLGAQPTTTEPQRAAQLASRLSLQEKTLEELSEKITQRDQLLRELTERLHSQRQDNELLQGRLSNANEQLAEGELKYGELVDDLHNASKKTQNLEATLEQVTEEKYQLEQELAERITDLLELNLKNDDLSRRLEQSARSAKNDTKQPTSARPISTQPASAKPASAQPEKQQAMKADTRVITLASGDEVHILHEFPEPPKRPLSQRALHILFSVLRSCGVILAAVLVLIAAGVITTSYLNDISYASAFDLMVKEIDLSAIRP